MSTEVFQIVPQSSFSAEAPLKTRSGRTKRTYRCKHCARIFKRSEHCARHERVHTQERPFPCSFCDRRYARKDLVKRHERSLHAEAYQAAHPSEFRKNSFRIVDQIDLGEIPCPPIESPPNSLPHHSDSGSRELSDDAIEHRSPLTPLTESLQVDPNLSPNYCLWDNRIGLSSDVLTHPAFAESQSFIPHDMQSSLGQFSPSSTFSGQERGVALEPMFNPRHATYNRNGHTNDSAIQLEVSPQEIHMAPMIGTGSELNSQIQPMEVDPLLLFGSEQQQHQIHSEATLPATLEDFSDLTDPRPRNHSHALPDLPDASPSPSHLLSLKHGLAHIAGSQSSLNSALPDLWSGLDFEGLSPFLNVDHSQPVSDQLPRVQREKSTDLPKFVIDEWKHRKICDDAWTRLPTGELAEVLLPTVNELHRFFCWLCRVFPSPLSDHPSAFVRPIRNAEPSNFRNMFYRRIVSPR